MDKELTEYDVTGTLGRKVLAVTGVTGTLGKVVAEAFKDTWHVRGCARSVQTHWRGYLLQPIDVTNWSDIQRWLGEAAEVCGSIDALVTCAGVSDVCPIEEQDVADWYEVIDVNLTGTWLCIREAVKHGATRVVTVASIHGGTPTSYPNRAAYTASKAGVVGLTRALAVELAPQGIAVNAVAPGHLPALMPGTTSGQELLDAAASRAPAGRLVTPEEVANVVYWLCNGAPITMTGQILVIDGAFSLNSYPL